MRKWYCQYAELKTFWQTIFFVYTDLSEKCKYSEISYLRGVGKIDETSFPIESMANDPTAKAIMENLNISPEKVKEIANSVISIKIYAVKPFE